MTTAAAIDRLVHHAVILEMTGTTVRADEATSLTQEAKGTTTITTTTTTNAAQNAEVIGEM